MKDRLHPSMHYDFQRKTNKACCNPGESPDRAHSARKLSDPKCKGMNKLSVTELSDMTDTLEQDQK